MARRTPTETDQERPDPVAQVQDETQGPVSAGSEPPTPPEADAASPTKEDEAPGPRPSRGRARRPAGARAEGDDGALPAGGRRGSMAAETYAAVNAIVQSQGLTKAQAFDQLGAEQARQPGTVAAAYYRAARAHGEGRPRAARGPRQPRQGGGVDCLRAIEALRAAIEELATLVRRQEAEIAQLRSETDRFGQIRDILSAPRRGRPGR